MAKPSDEWQPPEDVVDALCRVSYEVPGGARWRVMKHLSPLLLALERERAIRILQWLRAKELIDGIGTITR